MAFPRKFNARQKSAGLQHGWRSGLEESVATSLKNRGVAFEYETLAIPFLQPQKPRKYTPDYILPNGIIIETKGQFVTSDRHKHLLVKEQYPDLDIRFVFSNDNQRISKQSQTTYAIWCASKGFPYAKKDVPQAWVDEPTNAKSLLAINQLKKNPSPKRK